MAMIIVMAIMLVILRIWLIRGRMQHLIHNKERAILAGPCFHRATESSLPSATMALFNCAYTVIIAYRKSVSCAYA
jgi:hypothetical protein